MAIVSCRAVSRCGVWCGRCTHVEGNERPHGLREQPGLAHRGLDGGRCAHHDDVPHGEAKGVFVREREGRRKGEHVTVVRKQESIDQAMSYRAVFRRLSKG